MAEKRKIEETNGASKKTKSDYVTNHSFKQLLIDHPVEALAYKKENGLVFFVDRSDKVSEVFKGLVKHGFLSVPVLQKTKHKWYGFVDVGDVVQFYVDHFGDQLGTEGKDVWATIAQKEGFLEKTVDDVMKYPLTRKNIFHPITVGYSLYYAIETLAREEHLHRVPIIDQDRNLKSVLSQSQVIEFIHQNIADLGSIQNKPVSEMKGALKTVHSVNENSKAIDAFKMMQQHSLTGVAVVDDAGAIVGNLSLRDLKTLRLENQLFHRLFQTVHNFIRHLREEFAKADGRPKTKQVVHETDNLGHVIQILVEHNIHRVYVVDADKKPIGVVSLRDVLLEIISH